MTPDAFINSVASRWARLGVMLNVEPSDRTPDLERLLLDSARAAPANSRLFVLAATWLTRYGDAVAKHRLARLVRDELEPEHRPTLGFLLDWVRRRGSANTKRFNRAIRACGRKVDERPLFDVERRNPALAELARQRASPLSRKWGRWAAEFDLKDDALRPEEWVIDQNPSLRARLLVGGDLRASVLAECEAAGGPIASESELARRCGASRPAVREAVRTLRLAGLVRAAQQGRRNTIEPRPAA
jgi:hypothetical protein